MGEGAGPERTQPKGRRGTRHRRTAFAAPLVLVAGLSGACADADVDEPTVVEQSGDPVMSTTTSTSGASEPSVVANPPPPQSEPVSNPPAPTSEGSSQEP